MAEQITGPGLAQPWRDVAPSRFWALGSTPLNGRRPGHLRGLTSPSRSWGSTETRDDRRVPPRTWRGLWVASEGSRLGAENILRRGPGPTCSGLDRLQDLGTMAGRRPLTDTPGCPPWHGLTNLKELSSVDTGVDPDAGVATLRPSSTQPEGQEVILPVLVGTGEL